MPVRAKTAGHIANIVPSDSEPDFDNIDALHLASKQAATKGRGRGATSKNGRKVTKPVRKTARRAAGSAPVPSSASARKALVDKSNTSTPSKRLCKETKRSGAYIDTQESTQSDFLDSVPMKRAICRPRKTSEALEAANTRQIDSDTKETGSEAIVDGQGQESMQLDEIAAGYDDFGQLSRPEIDTGVRLSLQAAGAEEASIRRRLGDLTTKYENLKTRHRDLREVGLKAAERNYDRLKATAEDNAASEFFFVRCWND